MERMRLPLHWLTCLGLVAASGLAAQNTNFDRIQQLAQQRYGQQAVQTVNQWRNLIRDAQSLNETEKIRRVNDFFNRRLLFEEDSVIWGQSDYWATPLEAMGRGQADCEDYSIAKYTTLRLLGLPADRLRLTYVRARIGGPSSTVMQAHMVLGYYANPDAEPLILDNLLGEIRPASRRSDLLPVFSFNSEGLWVGKTPGSESSGSSTSRLSRWRDVIARMQTEGFE